MRYWLVLLFFSSFFRVLFAQEIPTDQPFLRLKFFNEEDGLSNNTINDIAQAPNGLIWVATNDGLFKFDGNEFTAYRNHPDDPYSLPDNMVSSLHLDVEGRLWALTDFGVGIYHSEEDQFTRLFMSRVTNASSEMVTSIAESEDGTKYLGTIGGIVVLRGDKMQMISPHRSKGNIPLQVSNVNQLHLCQDSMLWIGTWNNGLLRLNLNSLTLEEISLQGGDSYRIYSIFHGEELHWVGTNDGLYSVSETYGNLHSNHYHPDLHPWVPGREILSLYEDPKHTLWIGSRETGLTSIQASRLTSSQSNQEMRAASMDQLASLSNQTISKIFQDLSGNIWLGTHNAGITVFAPEGEIIRYYTQSPFQPSLSHPIVFGMVEADSNSIWVGTDGGGINYLDPYQNYIQQIPTTGFSDEAILSALKAKSGKIWLGTYAGGINIFDPVTGTVEVLKLAGELTAQDIRSLWEAPDGTIYIGTNGSGLHAWNSDSRSMDFFDNTSGMDIRAIRVDSAGHIWLAIYGNGLGNLDPQTGELSIYDWKQSPQSPQAGLTLALYRGYVWVGTSRHGLLRFDPKTKSMQEFSTSNGLSSNTVRAIVPDDHGHLWVSTNLGVSCLFPEEKRFQNFDYSHGLQLGQFNDNSGIKLRNGDLAFGGIHGINVFSPEEVLSATVTPPEILLSKVTIWQKAEGNQGENYSQNITPGDTLYLSHSQNSLSIDVSVLDLINSEAWRYEYRLLERDNFWNTTGSVGPITYRNLPPGKYTFEIRSTDISNTFRGTSTSFHLIIHPPWWASSWARIIYALLTGVVLVIIFVINTRIIRSRQQLHYEQKLRQQQRQEIQNKLAFFTNLSHELRTPLTLIQGPIEDLLRQVKKQQNRSLLMLIKKNSHLLLRIVNQLLEFRKADQNAIQLTIAEQNITEIIQDEIESFHFEANRQGVQLKFEDGGTVHCWADREKLQLIFNNLLSNALKYTPRDGTVEVRLSAEEESVQIAIQDSGVGIPQEQIKEIFTPFYQAHNASGRGGTGIGLALTKSLIELHHGTIEVVSNNSGSTFIVGLPNQKEVYEADKYVTFVEVAEEQPSEELTESQKDPSTVEVPTILVADDNPDILEYINSQLSPHYRVLSAPNGELALKIALKRVPDIIIADLMMPVMDGLELCYKIKAHNTTNHIPVIMLTAQGSEESVAEGYRAGADSYITKPFSSEVLLARIGNLLAQRDQLRSLFTSGDWKDDDEQRETPEAKFIEALENRIKDGVQQEENLSVEVLAEELSLSHSSLYRKIKTISGLSVDQFIRLTKLKMAAEKLANEDVTISEAAYLSGFNDPRYFRKYFKAQYGMLPSAFQQQHRKRQKTNLE